MGTNFQMTARRSNGNLHITLAGDFDGSSAWELLNLLHERYEGTGRVFIDTHQLRALCPFGSRTLQCHFFHCQVPRDRVFFKGEKGSEMAPQGSRVLTVKAEPRCRCDGRCENCRCSEKKEQNG